MASFCYVLLCTCQTAHVRSVMFVVLSMTSEMVGMLNLLLLVNICFNYFFTIDDECR